MNHCAIATFAGQWRRDMTKPSEAEDMRRQARRARSEEKAVGDPTSKRELEKIAEAYDLLAKQADRAISIEEGKSEASRSAASKRREDFRQDH